MKKIIISILIIAFSVVSCEETKQGNCLPYEGEFFDFGNPCSGIVIKVVNKKVNSSWDMGGGTVVENVVGIRFNQNWTTIDSATLVSRKFYFDFRELKPDEVHPCTAEWSSPRIVWITQFSQNQCTTSEK